MALDVAANEPKLAGLKLHTDIEGTASNVSTVFTVTVPCWTYRTRIFVPYAVA